MEKKQHKKIEIENRMRKTKRKNKKKTILRKKGSRKRKQIWLRKLGRSINTTSTREKGGGGGEKQRRKKENWNCLNNIDCGTNQWKSICVMLLIIYRFYCKFSLQIIHFYIYIFFWFFYFLFLIYLLLIYTNIANTDHTCIKFLHIMRKKT